MKEDPISRLRGFAKGQKHLARYRDMLAEIADDVEAQYMPLPLDADGVPIRPGDVLEIENGERQHTVAAVGFVGRSAVFASVEDARKGEPYVYMCNAYRHVKPDTVGSILNELIEVHTYKTESCTEDVIAEYAERIRKAVQDD